MRLPGEGHILQSLPGPGSATAKAFPDGRPLGTIFWARAKQLENPNAKAKLEEEFERQEAIAGAI